MMTTGRPHQRWAYRSAGWPSLPGMACCAASGLPETPTCSRPNRSPSTGGTSAAEEGHTSRQQRIRYSGSSRAAARRSKPIWARCWQSWLTRGQTACCGRCAAAQRSRDMRTRAGVWPKWSGKTLTHKVMCELLTDGQTKNPVKGFISKKTGKKYEAKLRMEGDRICPVFEK